MTAHDQRGEAKRNPVRDIGQTGINEKHAEDRDDPAQELRSSGVRQTLEKHGSQGSSAERQARQ